ncbi:MAG TPA: ABC transporter permease subunit, partial [Dokdonella sp.]|nr:ABC transporter permease subunit [Dokdonella sp.]
MGKIDRHAGTPSGACAGSARCGCGGWRASSTGTRPRALLFDTGVGTAAGGLPMIVLIIGGMSWMVVARIVRASFLAIRERTFVEAALAAGGGHARRIFLHILPNAIGPILVQATLQVAVAIIAESGLSYLGFGIQPPTSTWGNMLRDAQTSMTRY